MSFTFRPVKTFVTEKLRLRLTRLLESFEQITGARPGRRLQVEFRGVEPLEATLRQVGRRLALGAAAGAALIATAITAASANVSGWVPSLLGAVTGVLGLVLAAELVRR